MASSAADRLLGAGAAAGEELLLLHQHHPQMYYHVPQHSRREKLRFPPPEESPTSTSLLLHDPSVGTAPPLYTPAANSLAIFPPSSSAAPSAYPHHHGFVAPQFDGRAAVPFPAQHQIQAQTGFSLSLSSASSPRPPAARPHLASRPAPLGPFTGYATVLNRSRFLEPARKLLEEACHAGYHAADSTGREMLLETQLPRAPSSGDHGMEGLGDDDRGAEEDRHVSGVEQQWKKTTLISMLDEVCRRYRQYHQQVQTVITSFECVAGFSTAAPFVSVALKAMTKHFRCLKHIISEQLSEANKNMTSREDSSSFGIVNSRACLQRTADCTDSAFAQPNVWRPQRGLPERAVSVLRAWLFEHFLHPYPTDVDKQNLAKQTGLTRNQVSNWFINARVRLWKPMVEEIHSLEMHQKNKASSAGDKEQQPQQPSSSKKYSVVNPQQFQIDQLRSSKAIQEHIPAPVPNHIQQDPPAQYAYKNMMPSHQHAGAGGGAGIPSAGNSVSLTLGLHQHNGGACFSEPLPINVARRFGLEECGDSYLLGAFGGQERQLIGKDMGSRLFHDFVG